MVTSAAVIILDFVIIMAKIAYAGVITLVLVIIMVKIDYGLTFHASLLKYPSYMILYVQVYTEPRNTTKFITYLPFIVSIYC
jgi:hypothetical protein